jgi:putative DNA-invertase from lambdoid prophage Rac
MVKCAVYLRVSTSKQTFENQLPQLMERARSRGYEVMEVYSESESAWKDGHQKELSRLLADIRSGRRKYDVVLVWALDRLSRQGPLAVLTLIDTFKTYGVKVETVQEPFTALPYGFDSVVYSFLAWVAKYESDRKSERTKAGLERVLKTGVTKAGKPITKLGRPVGSRDKKKRRKKRPVIFKYGGVSVEDTEQ